MTRAQRTQEQSAESVYIDQYAAIEETIEYLQQVLDNMRAPSEEDPITWRDTIINAHIFDALVTFNRSVREA